MNQREILSVRPLPWLIQGGMGIAISHWPLARSVAMAGQLGVVSGTAIDSVFVRRLQDQGVDEALRAVLDRFPSQTVVREVLAKYASTKRAANAPYRAVPMLTHRNVQSSQDLLVLASFVEVALAKSGHDGLVGINLLTKVQLPTVPSLYGAMLAGVDYVLMGAGIPAQIPGILDRLALGEVIESPLELEGATKSDRVPMLRFDPESFNGPRELQRPNFLAIVSSHVLANALIRRSSGTVNGFVVESPLAGGHNAPPRGTLVVDENNEPIYGDRDRVDFEVMRACGVPFWIAGGITTPSSVRGALSVGATGVQVGTLFAYCRESGMEPVLRAKVIADVLGEQVRVRTSTRASSTGYPFKVADIEGTLSDPDVYEHRQRRCDLGYLREAYEKPNGSVGYRCPSEPVDVFVSKGGAMEDTMERTCLCNALMATAGFGQIRRRGPDESPIVTSGDCINEIAPLLVGRDDYGATDVIHFLETGLVPLAESVALH
jgi:NAD(P)H-dependent flavin oxidoreductase YrpB (nitropropane dioxygenase family)